MTAIFGPQNANAALILPPGVAQQRYGTAQTFVKDCSAPGRNDGTVLDAAFYNRIIGNLDYLVSQSGITATPGDMSVLYRAIFAALAGGAPAVLDTLNELAQALGDDPNFATTMTNELSNRVRVDAPQVFSTLQKMQGLANLGLTNVVQLDSLNRLPVADGSLLTGVTAQSKGDFAGMSNGTLRATAAAGALTVSVKTFAGANPSALDPVYFFFQDYNIPGAYVRVAVTAALSMVIPSGATLGVSGVNQGTRIWITAHNDLGVVRLGAIKCSDANGVFCPPEYLKYTTAVPGNAAKTFYSAVAITTAAPWRFIGFCEWTSLATAGTWVVPDLIELFGPGVKKPGDVVLLVRYSDSTQTSTTSTAFVGTNLSGAITPSSAANLVKAQAAGTVYNSAIGGEVVSSLFRAATQIGNMGDVYGANSAVMSAANFLALDAPNTTASTVYSVKIKVAASGTSIWNQNANPCVLHLEELMG